MTQSKFIKKQLAALSFNQPIKILCESYKVREQLNEKTGEVDAVYLEGVAITFGKPTRNRVSYTYQSGIKTHQTLVGKPFLDTHHDDSIRNFPPFGHVEDCYPGTNPRNGLPCLMYRANLDPEEIMFIRKAKRGDIPGVSIQVLVDDVSQKEDKDGGFLEANIKEYLELSAVLIPGDGDTSNRITEQFMGFHKEVKNPSNPQSIIGPDGIYPDRKVIKKDTGEEEPLEPLDTLNKQNEGKNIIPVSPELPNPEDPEDFRFVGKRNTEVAYRGCNCPSCSSQMLNDRYRNGFQLRCWRCDYRINNIKEV